MRLSKIKLAGFKSFVDPTTILFPGSRIGVVGPNGCGKSNVIDAVRWVMGESSAKHLRGDSMEDVIFNGSAGRKPVGQASIELVFDNAEGRLGGQYAEYAEIAIRREVGRDGQSQYYLNGTRCRRRDITDIFLGTGLGPRSYAIIEQGMISRLIEAKPEELRVYLEEAAGISKYKERRKETETRIRHTRENIERLNDLRDEVERQLKHLQRQANTAERYKTLRDEERRIKAELLALRLKGLDAEAVVREQRVREAQTRVEAAIAALRAIEAAIEYDRAAHIEAMDALNEVQGRDYGLRAEITRAEQSIQHAREMKERQERELAEAERSLSEVRVHLDQDRRRISETEAELAELEPRCAEAQGRLDAVNATLGESERAMADWQARWEDINHRAAEPAQTAQVERTRIEHLERQIQQLNQRRERLETERGLLSADGLSAEIEDLAMRAAEAQSAVERHQTALTVTLEEITRGRETSRVRSRELDERRHELQNLTGRLASLEALQQAALGKGEKGIVEWLAGQGLAEQPRLAERLNVDAGWERAVETVLGDYLEAVCVDDMDAVAGVLGGLEHGQVVLFDAGNRGADPIEAGAESLLARVRSPLALDHLLGGVLTAPDLAAALALRPRLAPRQSVITLDGVWLGRDWLRVARDPDEHAGVFAREAEIRDLIDKKQKLVEETSSIVESIEAARIALTEQEARRESLQIEVNRTHRDAAELTAQTNARRSRLEQVERRLEALHGELAEVDEQLRRDGEALDEASRLRNAAVERMAVLEEERSGLTGERERLRAALDEARREVGNAREGLHDTALRVEALRSTRSSSQAALTRAEDLAVQLEGRRDTLTTAIAAAGEPLQALRETLDGLLARRVELERELAAARAHAEGFEAALREKDQDRLRAEREVEEVRSTLDSLRLALQETKTRRQAVAEQFAETGFALDETLAGIEEEATVEAWHEKAEHLATRIQRLGPINLAAIDEFKEQSERKAWLDAQFADLNEALETLENAIHKIDRETRTRFRDTFERVNARLAETFPRLFNGGQAYLEMTGDDLLTTGVSIIARPAGKHPATIHQLSGGEKALTAVALVFAIFELNPAPFCMLDEVDAPLDDTNVGRFCELVRHMSERVQFVFITHNKLTMELAEQLVGVTMREPGVSRLVSVDIDEAARIAAA